MNQFLTRLTIVTLVSVVASIVFSVPAMQLWIGMVHPVGLFICIIAPILVSVPVTWFFHRQSLKLTAALEKYEIAHSQLKMLNRELEMQAQRDYLTGIMNRRHFVEQVSHLWKQCPNGALLCIDVDDFKKINDNFGHSAGDRAILAVASAIRDMTGTDHLIARFGGEEFSVFVKSTDYEDLTELAESIRLAVEHSRYSPVDGIFHKMSVSIGTAFVTEAHSFDKLVDIADQRMYDAKGKGKNTVCLPLASDVKRVA